MSLAWPDGHTSRLASIWPESSPAQTAFSSMSTSFTVMPSCFSRMTLATLALAAEPSHGLMARVSDPPEPGAGRAAVTWGEAVVTDPLETGCFLVLPHAASTRLAIRTTGTHRRKRLTVVPPSGWCCCSCSVDERERELEARPR